MLVTLVRSCQFSAKRTLPVSKLRMPAGLSAHPLSNHATPKKAAGHARGEFMARLAGAQAGRRNRDQIATRRTMAMADINAIQSRSEMPELVTKVDLGEQRGPAASLKLKSALRKTMIGDDPDTDARQQP